MTFVKSLPLSISFLLILTCNAILGNRNKFQWIASLDAKSGIAESLETSTSFLSESRLLREISDPSALRDKVRQIFYNYPYWLCNAGVTFGFLKARVVDLYGVDEFFASERERNLIIASTRTKTNNSCNSAVQICTSIFGIDLLTFGFSNRVDNKDEKIKNGATSVEFTVVSGLLAYKPAQGSIRFDAYITDESLDCNSKQTNGILFESRVVNYRPAIAGASPVNPVRRLLYLTTQRYVHSYVMYRFHTYLHNCINEYQ